MNLKTLLKWIYTKGSNYNLFMLEEHDYNDDDDIKDPAIILKHQKNKTRLYVILLAVCLYVLFYVTLIRREYETVVISRITSDIFKKLSSEHIETLSCPCRRSIISYENFVFNNLTMHPICSSVFVDKQWIEGLYFANASLYASWDFRTTAFSQFELLSKFCSLSNETIFQIQTDINNINFISIELQSEAQVQLGVDGFIDIQKNNAFDRIKSFLNYLNTTIQGNLLASALGTNWIVGIRYETQNIFYPYPSIVAYTFNYSSMQKCGENNFVAPATLNSLLVGPTDYNPRIMIIGVLNSAIVNGFFTACTPLEAILESTLHCLYETECIQLLLNYFPKLNQMNFNWNNSVLTSKHQNISVINHLNTLFIENWSTKINYSTYFHQCSPSMCTYTTRNRVNLSIAITLFISLYGGLIIILRFVASYFIDILSKLKDHSNPQNTQTFSSIQAMKQLNLFKNIHDRTGASIRQQRIITRIYLIFLFGSISILLLFTTLSNEITTITISNPSIIIYKSLENIYSTTLRCPCSNKTISHQTFMSFSPTFHQICSSGFIDDAWIKMLKSSRNYYVSNDWSNKANQQFQLLSDLCRLANRTIIDAIDRFLSQVFIASSIMNEMDFNKQLNSSINQFYQSTLYHFEFQKNIIELIMQVDQLYAGIFIIGSDYSNIGLIVNVITNETNNDTTSQIQLISAGIQNIDSTSVECVCAIDPSCQNPAVIYDPYFDFEWNNDVNLIYNISGWMQGCLAIDSLLLSTLQCLYVDSDCFPRILNYLAIRNLVSISLLSSSLRIQPLVYESAVSRFPPDTSVSLIVKELMMEQWNPSLSYQHFYESCAPIYCSYSQTVRKESFIGVIIKLVSMIGGIVVSLRMLIPHLVKFISRVSTKPKENPKQPEQIERSCIDRLKMMVQNLIKVLRTTFVELNIFTTRDLGSDVDRVTAKRYGRWATRLYILLFLSGLTILMFYTLIQTHTLTKTFAKPSFTYFNHLTKIYGDELKCSCSKIASTYDQFVRIEPVFHLVCTSPFVSEQWRLYLVSGLVPNLTVYEQRDYRRFLSAHLQYLQGLCQLSQQAVNNSISEFLTSLLVTVELLSRINFQNRLVISIEQSKSNAPVLFSRLLYLTQLIFHGNAFISTYGTDFTYLLTNYEVDFDVYSPTEAVIYDNECSCGMSSNCTTQATFIETNSSTSTKLSVKGMKMGCIPSESFRLSTLECFYDQSCLDLIQQYTNYPNSLTPLSTTTNFSRFPQNTTISELINHLFIEKWSTEMNYSSYYEQCLPSLCSYTSIEKFNLLYTITVILGIQGGLTIVLKWICPKLVRVGSKIYYHRKKRITPVHSTVCIEIPSTAITNTTWNCVIEPMNIRPQNNVMLRSQSFFKMVFVIGLLICILIGIIMFSIYYAQQDSTTDMSVINNSNTTIYTTIATSWSSS
ncbi:hypothetical protein I4U23_011707, partial [Adineta vaga]